MVTVQENWVETFGERVLELRNARGWSQAELAAKAGRSQSAIRDIERANKDGDYEPHAKTVRGIARAFGADGIELLRQIGRDDMADWLEEQSDEDPLEGLSAEEKRRVYRIAREIIDLGRGDQSDNR